MAEFIFKDYLKKKGKGDIEVLSAGFCFNGEPIFPFAKEVVEKRGIECSGHSSRIVDKKLFHDCDFIFTMTKRHKEKLETVFGKHKNLYNIGEITGEDVFDPYMMDIEFYEKSLKLIENAFDKIFEMITK